MTTVWSLCRDNNAVLLCTICFVSAAVTSVAVATPSTKYIAKDPVNADNGDFVIDLLSSTRGKRSLWYLGLNIVMRGAEASMVLLRGAKRVHSDDRSVRAYQKHGDYDTALKEFGRVLPTEVQHFNLPDGSKGMVGHVGDRTIVVESKGDTGNPTMLIMRNFGRGDEGTDKIIYAKKGERFSDSPRNTH